MTMGGREQETVMLRPHRMIMRMSRNSSNQEPVDLPLYNIIGWELTQRNMDCPEEGIRMIVVLRRKPWREVFTTYLPTILLMIATFITTFFKPEFFEAALGVNLTTMLMMTTIFMTSLSELTDTAYPKWIDFWLIFCQIIPLTEVVLLTLKEAYREEEGRQENVTIVEAAESQPVVIQVGSKPGGTDQLTDRRTNHTWTYPILDTRISVCPSVLHPSVCIAQTTPPEI